MEDSILLIFRKVPVPVVYSPVSTLYNNNNIILVADDSDIATSHMITQGKYIIVKCQPLPP